MTMPLASTTFTEASAITSLKIAGIGVGLAPTAQTVAEAAPELGLDAGAQKMFARLFGFNTLPYEPDAPMASLMTRAVEDLATQMPEKTCFSHVFHCHTLPTVRLHGADFAGGAATAPEQVSLGMAHCATGVAAFELLGHTLGPDDTALVLVGERAFHRRIRLIDDTTIMGEGAVALAVTRKTGPFTVIATHTTHDGCAAISRGHPTEPPQVGRDYTDFVASHLADAMDRFGITADAPTHIMPHNVNMVSWHPIAKAAGLDPKKLFLRNVGRVGHCFGADPFINLTDAHAQGLTRSGDHVLMTSVGMGLSAATMLVRLT
jgi:3-oxoacyl-[acyl-carrier-protein] synthase-3